MNEDDYNDLSKRLKFQDVLLDTLPNPVYYKDTIGRFIKVNTCFAELVNTTKSEIIGKSAYDFFPKVVVERHKLIDQNIMKTFEPYEDEVPFKKANGEIRYFTLNKAVCVNEDGTVAGIVCVMNDITTRTKEKEFLIQQSKFAEMGEMIASIAHQWNEPLVELSAQIQKMQIIHAMNKIDKNKMSDFVNDSMVQIKYMSETLSDFRNFLKPSTVKNKFGIKQALREIFDIVGKQIFYFNIKVNFEYENDEVFIYGYKNELKQVLLNIINNAKNKLVKLNEEKDFKGIITIKVHTCKDFNIIEICDNGGEIAVESMNQLFEPFFTTKVNGTGFGLYMAKIIIEDKMSGKIEVKNNFENVIFTIKIPLLKSRSE